MHTLNSSAPVTQTFGINSTQVHVWPDGLQRREGQPFGILVTAELYTEAAAEAQRMEAHVREVSWLSVLAEWEAERDAATVWLHTRGLGVRWDAPADDVSPLSAGKALRHFFIAPLEQG